MSKVVSVSAIALFVVLAGCTQSGGGKPSDTVRAAVEAMVALDFDKFNSYMSKDLQDRTTGLREMFDQLKQMGAQMSVSQFDVIEEKINGDTATVRFEYDVTATYLGKVSNLGPKRSEATLVKEDGVWKINGPAGSFTLDARYDSQDNTGGYSSESRSCPSNFMIISSGLFVSEAPEGTGGRLSLILANAAGHKITIENVTLGGDVTGLLDNEGIDVNAGDTTSIAVPIESGLTGSSGTLVYINAAIGFRHSATGFNNLVETTTCSLKLKIP
ncbi:DUF4878 domain-containing protein [Candidatus Micrarchaeota archaeon]|nr:DUF4878 domain-containing protein [Candidatus Micrarchaeota archaeon]